MREKAEGRRGAGRYAPSPSGDLHLGNLRTALLAWLFARSSARAFLMRIEDLDRDRDAGAASAQLADLQSLGLDWDDAPVWQSSRAATYATAFRSLEQRDLVYECTCTRRDILAAPSAPHAPPGAYPGTCRDRSDAQRSAARAAIAPRMPAMRLRVPTDTQMPVIRDVFRGLLSGTVDDFVLRRGDGTIAYNLAVVVDDHAMGIDQVVRGDDLADSTPRQVVLQGLLGYAAPTYAHVPLVLSSTGKRLAKRDGAITLRQLAAQGISTEHVRSALAVSLGLATPGERVDVWQLLQRFDPASLPRTPWVWGGSATSSMLE